MYKIFNIWAMFHFSESNGGSILLKLVFNFTYDKSFGKERPDLIDLMMWVSFTWDYLRILYGVNLTQKVLLYILLYYLFLNLRWILVWFRKVSLDEDLIWYYVFPFSVTLTVMNAAPFRVFEIKIGCTLTDRYLLKLILPSRI